jgi:membrane protein DedA with SNARE-associated domain
MLAELENFIITNLQNIYDSIGWLGVTSLLVFENATGIIPSEVILGLAGWMLLAAHESPFYSIFIWGAAAALGSTIGASITYWGVRLGGRPIVEIIAKWFRVEPQHIMHAEQKFHRWGSSTVFFGRMIPGVRTLINIPAGLARMPFLKFKIYTLLGAYIWCTLLIGGGYFLGHEWWLISEVVKKAAPWLVGLGLLSWVCFFTFRKITKRREHLAAIPVANQTKRGK